MAGETLAAPLGGSPPNEVPLQNAPLERVLAQARFPEQFRIVNAQGIDAFQQAVKKQYPLLKRDVAQQVQIDANSGFQRVSEQIFYRFLDAQESWRLTLAPNAVTLETESYVSREDLLQRLTLVLEAVQECFDPELALRIGMRYVDRVTGDATLEEIQKYVREGVLGIITTDLHDHVRHSISEAALEIEEGEMLLRWGLLPPGGTIDPGIMEAVNKRSWILDIDVYSEQHRNFSATSLIGSFESLAKRAYSVFRFMITEEFLTEFGGDA